MNRNLRVGDHNRRSAFTLIECVLAIGVVSVALVSILGLMPIALSVLNNSTEDTVLSHITAVIASNYRAKSFTQITNGVFYFDVNGIELPATENAKFRVSVGVQSQISSNLGMSDGPVKRLVLDFGAAAAPSAPPLGRHWLLISDSGRR